MYSFFKNFHSGLRYIVFVLLVIAIVQSLVGWLGKKPYTDANRKMNLFAMISAHTQLLIGLVLYFLSPWVKFAASSMKDHDLRYWTVEHISMMIIALALITVGHSRSKKARTAEAKHKAIAIFYILGGIIIVVAILQSGRGLLGMTS